MRQKSQITGTWAPRQVLTREQVLDKMVVRLKSRDYPAGQYDLTSGYGAFKKTRFRFPQMFREGSVAGDSTPACATSGKPSTRLPLGGLGQLVPSPEFKNSKNQEKYPQVNPEIKDYRRVGSATSANQATGVGHGVVTT